jgi:hypothetical protein
MATYFAGQQSKFDYFGLDYRCDDATCTSAIATAGTSRTIGHVIPSASAATRMLGFGVKGLMNTGPIVHARLTPSSKPTTQAPRHLEMRGGALVLRLWLPTPSRT